MRRIPVQQFSLTCRACSSAALRRTQLETGPELRQRHRPNPLASPPEFDMFQKTAMRFECESCPHKWEEEKTDALPVAEVVSVR